MIGTVAELLTTQKKTAGQGMAKVIDLLLARPREENGIKNPTTKIPAEVWPRLWQKMDLASKATDTSSQRAMVTEILATINRNAIA